MGDIADFLIANFMDGPEDDGLWGCPMPPKKKRCRYCGKGGFHWVKIKMTVNGKITKVWRLHDENEDAHSCQQYTIKQLARKVT